MTDFSGSKVLVNSYEGANMKLKVEYEGEIYMLKFGQKLELNNPLQASYSSAPISEYLGSHISQLIGIPAQETVLGTFKGSLVVACKDFIRNNPNADNIELVEFKKLETSFLGSSSAGGRVPLYDNLISIFNSHEALSGIRIQAEERYWQTFVVDSLIGNFDRHGGNWGYILDKRLNEIVGLAPVYDCGSSFYPQLNEEVMAKLLQDREALLERVQKFPTAALRLGNRKVKYHEFLLSQQGERARSTLGEIYSRINLQEINRLIDETPHISETRKCFYQSLVDVRREVILKPAYELFREERQIGKKEVSHETEISLKSEAQAAKHAAQMLGNNEPTQMECDPNR